MQSGFRNGHSCKTALLNDDDLHNELDNGNISILILMIKKSLKDICQEGVL